MRDILATPGIRKNSGPSRHRARMPVPQALCKGRRSVDGSDLLHQTAGNEASMTVITGNPEHEPAFIGVGREADARPIAVRARAGTAPGLFWLSGFNSDMQGTKAVAL